MLESSRMYFHSFYSPLFAINIMHFTSTYVINLTIRCYYYCFKCLYLSVYLPFLVFFIHLCRPEFLVQAYIILLCSTLLHFTDNCVFYKLKFCSNLVQSKFIDTIFSTAFAHFMSQCCILVILAVFETHRNNGTMEAKLNSIGGPETFSLLLYLLWCVCPVIMTH